MGYYKDVMNGYAQGPSERHGPRSAMASANNNASEETGEQIIARQRQAREARLDQELAALKARKLTP